MMNLPFVASLIDTKDGGSWALSGLGLTSVDDGSDAGFPTVENPLLPGSSEDVGHVPRRVSTPRSPVGLMLVSRMSTKRAESLVEAQNLV
jgi:hypothetical protein